MALKVLWKAFGPTHIIGSNLPRRVAVSVWSTTSNSYTSRKKRRSANTGRPSCTNSVGHLALLNDATSPKVHLQRLDHAGEEINGPVKQSHRTVKKTVNANSLANLKPFKAGAEWTGNAGGRPQRRPLTKRYEIRLEEPLSVWWRKKARAHASHRASHDGHMGRRHRCDACRGRAPRHSSGKGDLRPRRRQAVASASHRRRGRRPDSTPRSRPR